MLRSAGLETAIETLLFLAEWTEKHIRGADRDYGRWMRETVKISHPAGQSG